MATPVFKFNHPDLPNEDLYFIQNTFFELPQTIPMDLTTFIYYHLSIGRTLEGFFDCWEDLQVSGSTLQEVFFEEWFDDAEKKRIYEDAQYSAAIDLANINSESSRILKAFIQQKRFENESIADFIRLHDSISMRHFRDLDYYDSWHYIQEYFWENEMISEELGNYDDPGYNNEESLIALYKTHQFPLQLIPHKFRKVDFFKYLFVQRGMGNLLPDIFTDKELLLFLFSCSFPSALTFFIGDEFSNDRAFMEEAIATNQGAIGNASLSLKGDSELAIKSFPFGWDDISEDLKEQREIIVAFIDAYLAEFEEDSTDYLKEFLSENVSSPMNKELSIKYDIKID
jgi:hypothetical protein